MKVFVEHGTVALELDDVPDYVRGTHRDSPRWDRSSDKLLFSKYCGIGDKLHGGDSDWSETGIPTSMFIAILKECFVSFHGDPYCPTKAARRRYLRMAKMAMGASKVTMKELEVLWMLEAA